MRSRRLKETCRELPRYGKVNNIRGVYTNVTDSNRLSVGDKKEQIALLARRPGVEVMQQTLFPGATVWISPASDPDMFEFFYVLKGCIRLMLPEAPVDISTGGCFYVDKLESNVNIETQCETLLLYVTNKPAFDSLYGYQGNLNELMKQVDEKDHYTYRHSHNVMRYALTLARGLSRNQSEIDTLATAALFHDVGKCFVPDEVLNKPAKLTRDEYEIIMKHPIDSAVLLEPRFGKRVAEIARTHHERLDGSGYPLGLKADQIMPESRILAIADSFDTMTSKRVYSTTTKDYDQAAEELCSMPNLYDSEVCAVLRELVKSGEIQSKKFDASAEAE